MTIAWCMRRAEMVYKCVKGYLMEVSYIFSLSASLHALLWKSRVERCRLFGLRLTVRIQKRRISMYWFWYAKGHNAYFCVIAQVCGVCGGSAVGGGVTIVPHYNIHFVLPSGLADGVYQQISAMFPTIFHLVPSVSMPLQESWLNVVICSYRRLPVCL